MVSFKLESFEGPLDLLLHLISKHKLDIKNIEISLLLEQYLQYIEQISEADMEYAGEFLEMAAKLIYIKTVSLLPSVGEAVELKKELEGRLIEYSLCKKAAQSLREIYAGMSIFIKKPMQIEIDKTYTIVHDSVDLLYAYSIIYNREKNNIPVQPAVFKPIVSKKIVSVTSKILFILKKLYSGNTYYMDNLYDGITDRSERVATFLAVLELTKSGRIILSDDNSELFLNKPGVMAKSLSEV